MATASELGRQTTRKRPRQLADEERDVLDTFAAFEIVALDYPREHGGGCRAAPFPVVIHHQLYAVRDDRTAVDREVEAMCASGVLLRLKAPWGDDSALLCRTADVESYIEGHRSVEAEGSRVAAAAWDAVGSVVADDLVVGPTVPEPVAKRAIDAVAAHFDGSAEEARRRAAQTLVGTGLFVHTEGGGLALALPEGGRLSEAVTRGRTTLLNSVRRTRFREVLWHNLERKRWRGAPLGARFHLRDLAGQDLVDVESTTAGKLVRVSREGT